MRIVQKNPDGNGWIERGAEGQEPFGLAPPGRCLFTGDIDGPFLDLEIEVGEVDARVETYGVPGANGKPSAHAYIHIPYLEGLGREIGMQPLNEFQRLQEKLVLALEELAELRQKTETLTSIAEVMA